MSAVAESAPAGRSFGQALMGALRSFALLRESKVGMVGVGIILLWIVVAITAGWIAPYDPNRTINREMVRPFETVPVDVASYPSMMVRVSGVPDDVSFSEGEREGGDWVVTGYDILDTRIVLPEDAEGTISFPVEAWEVFRETDQDGNEIVTLEDLTSGTLTYDISAAMAEQEADDAEDVSDAYGNAYGQQQPQDDSNDVSSGYGNAYGQQQQQAEPEEEVGLPIDLTEGLPVSYVLGTDHSGRDIFSRVLYGSRTVLMYAPLATICAYFVGILLGLAAGYYRGWVDSVLSFIGNVILSFPVLVLYIVIISIIGASGFNIVLAVTFASAPGILRIVRGLVLDLRNREYVAAAQTRGESSWYIMLVEILPNARGPLIVDACLRMGYVTITIGVLGFLGLGLPPPDPDWGGMVNDARNNGALTNMHTALFPCIAISSLVLGLNLLADGLREVSLRD